MAENTIQKTTAPEEEKQFNEEEFRSEHVNEENKNKNHIRCPICDSKVLNSNMAPLIAHEVILGILFEYSFQGVLPVDRSRTEGETQTERFFWHIKNMWDFENIGFTKTLNDIKYLTCADCEKPCLGNKKNEIF